MTMNGELTELDIPMLRSELTRCRQRGELLALSLDIARKKALNDAAEIERLRVAESILRKLDAVGGFNVNAAGLTETELAYVWALAT